MGTIWLIQVTGSDRRNENEEDLEVWTAERLRVKQQGGLCASQLACTPPRGRDTGTVCLLISSHLCSYPAALIRFSLFEHKVCEAIQQTQIKI